MAAARPAFMQQLEARARAANSLLCVGLDPRTESVAELRKECARLIEATAEAAAAFKPNSAFFEVHGPEGWQALRDVIASVPEGIPVILDAKRGDIADTAEAYARAVFDGLGAGSLTVSPYLGGDSLAPFVRRPEHGAFVLCHTSNPGAGELQELPVGAPEGAQPLYEWVARQAPGWTRHDNLGLVVGATRPGAMVRVRALAPRAWILAPGVGAQVGDLAATVRAGLRNDGLGLLVNVSRGLARAADPKAEAQRLAQTIREIQAERQGRP